MLLKVQVEYMFLTVTFINVFSKMVVFGNSGGKEEIKRRDDHNRHRMEQRGASLVLIKQFNRGDSEDD